MWSSVFVGFAYVSVVSSPYPPSWLRRRSLTGLFLLLGSLLQASLARRFLIDDPSIVFPLTLQQVAVFSTMRKSFNFDSATVKKQMRVFWYGILVVFIWQFVSRPCLPVSILRLGLIRFISEHRGVQLPEYAFPMLSSLTLLCWVSSNPKVTFAGSGLGGAGFGNITLDWSVSGRAFLPLLNSDGRLTVPCCPFHLDRTFRRPSFTSRSGSRPTSSPPGPWRAIC